MNGYRLTAAALDDLDQLLSYVDENYGVERARTVEQALFDTFSRLAEFRASVIAEKI